MDVFRLDTLDPILVEKIFTKFRGRSYCNLQQTCHWVNDFIRRSRNISVHVRTYGSLLQKDGTWYFHPNFKANGKKHFVEALYGVRLAILQVNEIEGEFESLCDCLKKYRITCNNLRTVGKAWTTEQCTKLMELTKPIKMNLMCNSKLEPTRAVVLLQSKILRHGYVVLYQDQLSTVGLQLMSKLPEVTIRLLGASDLFGSLRTVLQILRSNNFPNLKKFEFVTPTGRRNLPTKRQFDQEFCSICHDFKKAEAVTKPWIVGTTHLPQKPGFTCLMIIEVDIATITLLS